ncbi:phage tail tape measure protein [Pseudomonas sp. 5P_3.1_Bac2]|uniref:phage tail tape measure protein n=1 Tax=Pseudomonas sp. 5P_3.1_Bac2 TaxID=2971617 RepID=UPI0021CAC496|nr:phage tail tape measure protein [Pseudomonas sp. 5P_3.1_Bac2]MCU1717436.1 phage tail tape measure protein [Pseudomonas sp. 5P_3.1_Bac2]
MAIDTQLQSLRQAIDRTLAPLRGVSRSSDALIRSHGDIIRSNAALIRSHGNVNQNLQALRKQLTAVPGKPGAAAGVASRSLPTVDAAAVRQPLLAIIQRTASAQTATNQLKAAQLNSQGQLGADFPALNQLATRLGEQLPGNTADYQGLLRSLQQQGLSSQAILGGSAEAVAYMAVQSDQPLAQAAANAVQLQRATGSRDNELLPLLDNAQRAANLGLSGDEQLRSFQQLRPLLASLPQQGVQAATSFTPLLLMLKQIGSSGEAAGQVLGTLLQGAQDPGRVQAAQQQLQGMNAGFSLNFSNAQGDFAGVETLLAQLQQLQGLTGEQRGSVLQTLFGDDSGDLQGIQQMLEQGLGGYQAISASLAQQADLQSRVNLQLDSLANVMQTAQERWDTTAADIGTTVEPQLKSLLRDLTDLASAVSAWVKEHPQLTALLVKSVAALALLASIVSAVALAISTVLLPVGLLRSALGLLGLQGGTLLTWVRQLAAWLGSVLGRVLLSLGGQLLSLASTLLPLLGTALSGLMSLMLRLASSALPMVGQAIMLIGRALLTNPIIAIVALIAAAAYLIYQNWEPIKTFFLGLWEELKAGFSGTLGDFFSMLLNFSPLGMFYRAFAAVMNYFGFELPGKFSEMGGQLMQGLVQGITNGLAAVSAAVSNAADSTVLWFKEKLGIHSPSRVFAELGGFTMAGLEQGLLAGQNGPLQAVSSLSKQLLAAGSLALAVNGPALALDTRAPLSANVSALTSSISSPSAAPVITINLYPSAGMNEQQLAQMVGNEVEKRLQAQQVRQRSSFIDQD